MPQSAESRVATAARRLRCVELASQGLTYAEIASAVGYANKSSARKAVVAALAAREVDGVDMLRSLEVARLDELQLASWDHAMTGDPQAVDRVVRIINLRAKLLGLFDIGADGRPSRSTSVVTGEYSVESAGLGQRRPAAASS
jgi:hypothetical protein